MNPFRKEALTTVLALAWVMGFFGLPEVHGAEKVLRFRMDWKIGGQHSPYLIADQKGFYKAEGLSVQVIGGSGSSVSLTQLGGGAIEFGLVDAPVLVQGRVKGVPVRSIAVYYQRTPQSIMWNADKHNIQKPRDLVGLRIGANRQSSTFQGFQVFLRAQGIDIKQVTLVPVTFGIAPFLAGQVDATLAFTMIQPLMAEDKGVKVGEMLFSDHGVQMYSLTISTRDDLIRSDPKTIRSFLKASLKGIESAVAHRDEAVAAVKKVVPQADGGRERRVLDKLVETVLYPEGLRRVGLQTEGGWSATQDTLFGLKLIEEKIPVDRLFTNAFHP